MYSLLQNMGIQWYGENSIHVDYLLHWQGLQAQRGVDNLRIFPYNEHAT
jgi:hypothetical protein